MPELNKEIHRPQCTISDTSLKTAVTQAQNGDEESFRCIYRAIQPDLLNYVRALVGEADAEDVASETWSRIARDLPIFHGDANGFRKWTSTIAHHRAIDHLRRKPPQPSLSEEVLTCLAADNDTEEDAFNNITTTTALALIAGLPPDQAQALLLRVVIGLDAPTTGKILGKQPGAIRTAAYRGLRNLDKRLRCTAHTTPWHYHQAPPEKASAMIAGSAEHPIRHMRCPEVPGHRTK